MSWKFWEKKKPPAEPPLQWANDSYGAVQMLAALYVGRATLPPFNEWRSSEVTFQPKTLQAAERAVHGIMLADWFIGFRQVHGAIAAQMARDALWPILDSMSHTGVPRGESTEAVLALIDEGRDAYNNRSDELRAQNVPELYFISLRLLMGLPESPYAETGQGVDDMQGDDVQLPGCLLHGCQAAARIWEPMLAHIGPFNPGTYPQWRWSGHAGTFERHLQRRHLNPLYPPERQRVAAMDVYYARVRDAQALQDVRRKLEPVLEELRKGDLPINWHSYLNNLREQLDEAFDMLVQANGDAKLAKVIVDARAHVIETWRAAVGDTPEGLQALEHAEEVHYDAVARKCSWVSQLLNPNTPIQADEVAISLLSESGEDIKSAVTFMADRGALDDLRKVALHAVLKELAEGRTVPEHTVKLAAMGVSI